MIGTMARHGKITRPPSVRNFGRDFASTQTKAPLAFGGDYSDIVGWFFLGHMIFALFLELATMTNISSSLEVYLSINGFMMLAIGSTVGALFALLVYMITLFSVPMLVAREVDFVTAMIVSFQAVQNKFFNLMIWTLNHCGIYIFVHVAVVFRAVSDSAFIWACGMASL